MRRGGREMGVRAWVDRSWRHAILLPLVAVFVLPLVWMTTTSLRETGKPLPRTLEWVGDPVAWSNYPAVFDLLPLWRFAANSAFVVAVAVPLTILVASWAGFAMAQLPREWRLRLTLLSFGVQMVPLTAVWLTRFVLFKQLGLIDTPWALIAPAVMGSSPFYVLLFLWTFLRVPREVFESARLDGANPLRVWVGIAMPLARPTIIAVSVLAFVLYWSSFVDPLVYIRSTDRQTLPFALQMLFQLDRSNWPLLMAGAVLVTGPVVLVFLLAQRYFLQEFRGQGFLGR
ncbi:MAG: N-Acetyl-D-glucosamine ABC transport system, permease protein 2 [uncultured Thermomicrobiales bacterium]|uniref:sn-glycerol-3-phosphate transport system permease protein UgpE n=1 Tax=uncultured Thermomicrobiales bacterium TaxID=1645740 RepID=A0A6J4UJ29_9BACT|nr:MAG: N-Acetyl-D-glucosamine ABC transport system, permease protein 2 [uncultured Thermomicrobiales bacterium]